MAFSAGPQDHTSLMFFCKVLRKTYTGLYPRCVESDRLNHPYHPVVSTLCMLYVFCEETQPQRLFSNAPRCCCRDFLRLFPCLHPPQRPFELYLYFSWCGVRNVRKRIQEAQRFGLFGVFPFSFVCVSFSFQHDGDHRRLDLGRVHEKDDRNKKPFEGERRHA